MEPIKTPEQIAAEQKFLAEKKQAEEDAAAELALKREAAGDEHFVYGGRVFKPIVPKIQLPKIGIRTALELCTDEEAQKYLVEVPGNIGTVISEIE